VPPTNCRGDPHTTLAEVFVGEVKHTQDTGYVAIGLREFLEYMAFVKHTATDE